MKHAIWYVVLVFVFWMLSINLWSAWFNDIPTTLTQPDGSVLECLASGDEFHNWLHDREGYTIMHHPKTGFYVYAEKMGGELVAGTAIAGRDNPRSFGIAPHLNISKEQYSAKRALFDQDPSLRNTPITGTLNNIIIYIRFSDQTEFSFNTSAQVDMYNSLSPGVVSVRNYFWEESYQSLDVVTHMLPTQTQPVIISYQHNQPRSYYTTYNEVSNPIGYTSGNFSQRRMELFSAVLSYVNPMLPSGVNFDADNDGYIDNVIFLLRGSHDGWGNFLWPHKSSIGSLGLQLGGKTVGEYNLGLEFMSGVSTACHEFTHTLGAPDYYHYSEDSTYSPVGMWDVMANNLNPPQHTSAFTKWKYIGWIDSIPTIAPNQTYTINPLSSSTNNAFRINSPYTDDEYFVVEYRRNIGTFESSLPGSGLVVWRVNGDVASGNASGPPDELYVYRPTSSPTATGTLNQAFLSAESGRITINNTTNPHPFLSNGNPSGISIQNVGSAGETISFYYGDPFVDFETNPVVQSFDPLGFPPDGCESGILVGSEGYERVSEGTNPFCSSFSGDGMLSFECRANPGGSVYLATPKIMVQDQANALYSVGFWMHRDEGYTANADKLEIYRNTTPDLSGAPVLLGTVHRSTQLSPAVSTAGWHRYSFLISPPSNGNYHIILKGISAGGNNIYLDELGLQRHCRTALSWASPADNATGVDADTALSWNYSGPVPEGTKLYFGTNYPPSSLANGVQLAPSTTSWTNPDLLVSDTSYYWQIVPYNEYGKAYEPPIRSFRTNAIEPLSGVSFFEGFEIGDEYSLPEGWKSINANNDTKDWNCIYGIPYNGDKYIAVSMDSGVQGDDWAISRGMVLNAGTDYLLSYYYRRYGQSYSTKYAVYLSNSADPADPKETIEFNDNVTNPNYDYFEQLFSPATSGVYYIMFHSFGGPFGINPTGIAIDDFLLRGISTAQLGSPQPAPGSFGIPLDASFSWEVQSGSPTGYYISLGTDNPPTNVYHRLDIGNTLTWSPPQALEYDQQYYWSVAPYDNYGEALDPPVWSFFSELNDVIDLLPYLEGFDSTSGAYVPTNWSRYDLDADGKEWKVSSEASYTAPKLLKVERNTSASGANDDWAISPPIKLCEGFNYQLSFWVRSSLVINPGRLRIALGEAPDPLQMTWEIYNNANVNNNIWAQVFCDISPLATGNYYIGFHCYSPNIANSGVYLYLDEIQLITTSVAQAVHSPQPADNSGSVYINTDRLSWDNSGDVLGYRISIGTDNPPTNMVSNLDLGNQAYYEHGELWPFDETIYWQVVAYNSNGDSENNPVYSFHTMTEGLISTFPYYETFESLSTPNLPAGYLPYNLNQDTKTWVSRSTTPPFPTKTLSMDSSELIADDWLFLPGVSVEEGTYYNISFIYRNDRNRTAAKLELYRGLEPSPGAMTNQLYYNDGIVATTGWNEEQSSFRASITGKIYFGFHCFTSAEGGRLNLDNIEIVCLPTPVSDPLPENNGLGVSLKPVFSWCHAQGNPLGYRFYLGTDNPPTDIYNGIDLGLGNEMYQLEPLTYSSVYYWKVIPYNAIGDAPECPTYYFTTMDQSTISELPYSQNFDDYTVPQLPYDWSNLNANQDFGKWASSDLNPRSEPNSARLGSNFSYNSFDDWLFSPAISLTKGLQYRLSFYVKQTGYRRSDNLAVYLGNERIPEGMDIEILQTTVSYIQDANYTIRQVDFSAGQSGAFYLGFYSLDSTPGTIYLDDFSVHQISASFKPPRNLSALAGSESISLTWLSPVTGNPSGYKLFRNGLIIANIASGTTAYTDNDVLPGLEYLYFVSAVYEEPEGESAESNHVYVSLLPAAPLSPQEIILQALEDDIMLSWQAVETDELGNPIVVNSYLIYASDHPDFEVGAAYLIGTTDLTSFAINPTYSRLFIKVIAVKEP